MAIDKQLEEACLRAGGWGKLFEVEIERVGLTLGPANARGERTCRSPFPFSEDGNPSFSVNEYSGLWIDWHAEKLIGMKGGNFVQFLALMNAPLGGDGKPKPNWTKTEHGLKIRLGLANPVNKDWLVYCQGQVDDDEAIRAFRGAKWWTVEALRELGVGWDTQKQRFIIPVHDRDGEVSNTRLYKPKRTDLTIPKYLWSQPSLSGNFLFPYKAWSEQWSILVEGEGDVITLRSLGYNACCGTLGGGNMVPEGMWWYGKKIYVFGDADVSGAKGVEEAVDVLIQGAASVFVVTLPEWEGRPKNGDVSDWVLWMAAQGLSIEEVRREITGVIKKSVAIASVSAMYDMHPKKVLFREALTSDNCDKRLTFDAHLVSAGSQKFKLPTLVQVICPGSGQPWCKSCAMGSGAHRGNARFALDPRAPFSLKVIQCSDLEQLRAIKEKEGIAKLCTEPTMTTLSSVDMEAALLTSTLDEDYAVAGDAERSRHEAFIVIRPNQKYTSNKDYRVTGFVYAMPKTQKLVFLVDTGEQLSTRFDQFDVETNKDLLAEFDAKLDPFDHIMDIADDMALSVTGIWQRPDLHAAYLIVWHCLIEFDMFGTKLDRGWLECLVLGDTRCGKSKAFKKMSDWYKTGILIDCKMQSAPGLLGAVETSSITGERYVLPGIFPQCDARGPLAMDEFSASRESRANMMDSMSSTRAEGKVTINKAAHATFWARVRTIWMSNPGMRKLMRDIGGYGVEIVQKLINQPEDIARFDFAMAVSQNEVPNDVLNPAEPVPPLPPRRSKAAAQALLTWAWSRRHDQVKWDDTAERMVTAVAASMCDKYDSTIPLVEPADQRNRVGKVAVAVAVLCHSNTDNGETVFVTQAHVLCASKLFYMWYDKPTMGYDQFSKFTKINSVIVCKEDVVTLLDIIFKGNELECANRMMRFAEFSDKMLSILSSSGSVIEVHSALRCLTQNRCINPTNKETYTLTKQFVNFLNEEYIPLKTQQLGVGNE